MLIKKSKKEFEAYLEDTSNLKGNATLLYLPKDAKEIIALVSKLNSEKTPFTISAGKTGTTGGCVPLEGVAVSIENLKEIIDIDKKQKIIRLGAGVTFEELEKEINKYSLTLSAAPTESLACVGGGICTAASGVRGFGYGSIRKYVLAINLVLADASTLDIRRGDFISNKRLFDFKYEKKAYRFNIPGYSLPVVKSQAGYFVKDNMDLIDLFIGSEGTLGIITSCALALQDEPFNAFDGLIFFAQEEDGFIFVDKIKRLKTSGMPGLAALEFFDRNALKLLKDIYSFIPDGKAAVYFEQVVESPKDYDVLFEKWTALIKESTASLDDVILGDNPKERQRIFEVRHKLPQLINEFLRHHNQLKKATDIAVPWQGFSEMYNFYKEIAQNSKIDYVNFGHIGESHLHFNFLPKTEDQAVASVKYLELFCKKAVSLGGTISAEHGIGKIKKPYLKIMYDESQIKEMVSLKKYFDHQCLLGRDNIFDRELLFKI